jgi:hypothetical protein
MADRYDFYIALVVAVISIISACLGGFLVNQGAFDQWNRQIAFDKQGAAQQFSIEITSMKETLHIYATSYFQNKDIMCNGSNIYVDRNKITALNFGDISRPYKLIYNNQSITVYKGYPDPHYSNMKFDYVGFFPLSTTPIAPIEISSCYPTYIIMPPPLYNEHGMYYTYVTDIPKFDSKLATKLNIFYNDVTSAEANRQYVQTYLNQNVGNSVTTWQTLKGQYFSAYMDMRMSIINASELEPSILQELDQQIQNQNGIKNGAFQMPALSLPIPT